MTEVLPFVVVAALLAFILTIAVGPGSAEKPPLYWSLMFVTGCCAVAVISLSIG